MSARKRSASEAIDARRRSGRLSSTPKKSTYFEDSDDDSEDELSRPGKRGRVSKEQVLVKEDTEDQYEDEADDGEPDADEDVHEVESEDDEDAPPRLRIIPLEKMRDTGGVDYEDAKLHKNTMLFLTDLKAHNQRPWLKSHDEEYRRALKDWQSFVESTTLTIIDVDETVPELPAKDVNFRIHRDIRFSKDPTPYKPHFSAAWSRTGRKGPYACYYIHCEPKNAFIGGGLWCPEKQYIDRLRRSIDRHPVRWRQTLNEPHFKKLFLPAVKGNASSEGAIKAFIERNKSNALKKRPMGYEVTHTDIGLLKLRNYTVSKKIDESILCRDDAQEQLTEIIRGLSGFITFLNSIVMPDSNLDEDEDESDDESDDNIDQGNENETGDVGGGEDDDSE